MGCSGRPPAPVNAPIGFWFRRYTKTREQPESCLRLFIGSSETVNFAKRLPRGPAGAAKIDFRSALFDGRVMHRRRQGLGVNGLIVMEATAEHQGARKHGKS